MLLSFIKLDSSALRRIHLVSNPFSSFLSDEVFLLLNFAFLSPHTLNAHCKKKKGDKYMSGVTPRVMWRSPVSLAYQVHRPALHLASQSCGDSHHFLSPYPPRNNLSSLDLQILTASNFTAFSLAKSGRIVMTPGPFKDRTLSLVSVLP